MPPFNGHPQGFSAAALELLDQGLNEIWNDMRIAAIAKAKVAAQQGITSPPSATDAHNQPTRSAPLFKKLAPVIAK